MLRRRSPLLLLLAALGFAAPACGQSLEESVRRVERETGGRILSAETFRAGEREIHRIKVLTPDGRVRVIQQEGGMRGGYQRDSRPLDPAPARRERPRVDPEERDEDDHPARRGRGAWEEWQG
jgi:hypothetical protein